MLNKYRVHEVAKDFGKNSKEIADILTQYATTPKNHMQVLDDRELSLIFESLTQRNQVESIESIYADVYREPKPAQPAKQEAFQPLPAGFTATPINDVEALERLFETQGDRICAVMIECIQGESGVHPCTEEFVGAIRRLTEEYGALMICDEVQSGIFRTGLPYGFQNFGVLPDIVTMAKGIASGVVAGACAAKSSIAAAFAPGDHGTTFGGSNIAMAAAHVTLSTLLAPGMGAQIESVGAYMRERLARLPHVQEVRGFGLMNGIDLTHEAPSAPDVVAAGLEAGLVLNATGPHTLRFLPPLICTEADVDVLVQKLEQLL